MTPKRCGVCALTTTIAAPGASRRYSSAMSSAGTLSGVIVQTSRSAILRSASSASVPPRSKTLGFCMFVPVLADEADLAARPAPRVGASSFEDTGVVLLVRLVALVFLVLGRLARSLAAQQEQLEVARIVQLVVRGQGRHLVGCHGLREPRRDDDDELRLLPAVVDRTEERPQDRDVG